MVFSSLSFLYLFFPLCGLAYFLCRNRAWRNGVLLAFSLVFYAWGEPKNIILLLLASLTAYLCGLGLERWKPRPGLRRAVFLVGVVLLAGNLFVFKYLNFFCGNLGRAGLPVSVPEIALPIGISFYTFQILSYVIDLYRGEIQVQRNFFYLTLYVSFFPQLIAGPIVRYQTIEAEILERRESLEDISAGLRRFVLGLAKKVIIADNVGHIAEIIYKGEAEVYGSALYWLAAVAYALQIYFDFSGYSDMAIGMGRMFGFHFLENFNYPYMALSITDFWRRWHISLSTWFRDYIYIPLGGNRVKKSRWVLNLLAVWALTGFWHGAQWNFLLWGLYYGIILLVEKLWLGRLLDKCPKPARWLYAMVLVLVGWVIFNLTDFGQMSGALGMMFRFAPTDWAKVLAADASIVKGLLYLPLGLVFSAPLLPKLRERLPKDGRAGTLVLAGENLVCLGLAVLSVIYVIGATYDFFIYFRF
ncbi:MAG: MBOAT family protein [Acutalibacter sp.]|nr:MBOAT family protein [Acutalibacter sp.]